MATLQDPQQTLNNLYALRDDIITGKVKSMGMGDVNYNLPSLDEVQKQIQIYESLVTAGTPIVSDIHGIVGVPPWPQG
jgi:hypothetical protein